MVVTYLNRLDVELEEHESSEVLDLFKDLEFFYGRMTLENADSPSADSKLVFWSKSTNEANHELARSFSRIFPTRTVTYLWVNSASKDIGGDLLYQAGNVVSDRSIKGERCVREFLDRHFYGFSS